VLAPSAAAPWASVSLGAEVNRLYWEQGIHHPWSLRFAMGPRLYRGLYLRAKICMPIPFFVMVGNQLAPGGELVYHHGDDSGLSFRSSLGASWNLTWPEDVIVIMYDGETAEPKEPELFEHGSGVRLQAGIGAGWRFKDHALWLDLGLDHRKLDVLRFDGSERLEERQNFTGFTVGLATDFYL
jgi:hypothetical protein